MKECAGDALNTRRQNARLCILVVCIQQHMECNLIFPLLSTRAWAEACSLSAHERPEDTRVACNVLLFTCSCLVSTLKVSRKIVEKRPVVRR